MFTGIFDISWMSGVAVTLLFTHFTMASATIFLHRYQAHRALNLHPLMAHVFRFWLWLTTGMVTREWVAVHRKHHARCETADDPHSPQVVGLKRVLWGGTGLYQREASNPVTVAEWGTGTPRDWIERHLYERYSRYGLALMLVLDYLLFGLCGAAIWLVQMLWVPFWAAGVLNGIGHFYGYRNYAIDNEARNIFPWGIFLAGEELHNNHHKYAGSARFSMQWWEIDIGWLYIRALEMLRLAKVRHRIL